MKKLLPALFLLLSFAAVAQKRAELLGYKRLPVDSTTHLVTYSSVVPVEGVSKDDLYLRAKEWAARLFADSKAASRMDDKEAGTLVTHAVIKQPSTSVLSDNGGTYGLVLAIYVKDGRYKYVIDQLTYAYKMPTLNGGLTSAYRDMPQEPVEGWGKMGRINARYVEKRAIELDGNMKALVADLSAAMLGKPTSGGTKSDW